MNGKYPQNYFKSSKELHLFIEELLFGRIAKRQSSIVEQDATGALREIEQGTCRLRVARQSAFGRVKVPTILDGARMAVHRSYIGSFQGQ